MQTHERDSTPVSHDELRVSAVSLASEYTSTGMSASSGLPIQTGQAKLPIEERKPSMPPGSVKAVEDCPRIMEKDRPKDGYSSAMSPAAVSKVDSMASMMSTPGTRFRRRCAALIAILAYVISGLTIVVVNKCIVRDSGLHAPALISSTGPLFTAALTRILVAVGKVQVKQVDCRPWEFAFRRALPVGVFAAGSLCFGNMSYIYLDAGFVQMLKAGTPALLLLVLSVLRLEKISCLGGFLALCMVGGSTLATCQQPHATLIGLIVQMASQLCEVLQCTAVQFFLQRLGFEAWDAGYYLAPAIAACCLMISLVLEWPRVIAEQKVWLLFDQLPLLCASGVVGIVVNLSSLLVIKFTSSLLAKLLVIVRSGALVLFFIATGEDFTWLQVVGYAFTICAFSGYSVVKAKELEQQEDELEREGVLHEETADEDLLEQIKPSSSGFDQASPSIRGYDQDVSDHRGSFDLTSFMFWFAIFVVFAGSYQAVVLGDMEPQCVLGDASHGLWFGNAGLASSVGVPPTPYFDPAALEDKVPLSHSVGSQSIGMLNVQSSAKVFYLQDGRFLIRSGSSVLLSRRMPEDLLSSSWLISSSQFGTVRLQGLDKKGAVSWLTCDFKLTNVVTQACILWMTASHFDRWSPENAHGEFILRRHGDTEQSLATDGSRLLWGHSASSFYVADWVPESCPLRGMQPAPTAPYEKAKSQVTFTMTTFFRVYARSIMFRQALSSVFTHLKERDFYIREFLVINDWYDGRSLALNGTFTGPGVHESRKEMLSFFPGCNGMSVDQAHYRLTSHRCSFIFKDKSERGQAKSLNILLDLMLTEFWIHFEDDQMFYQDFYVSRLLEPIYKGDQCSVLAETTSTSTFTSTVTSTSSKTSTTTSVATTSVSPYIEPTVWPELPTVPPVTIEAPPFRSDVPPLPTVPPVAGPGQAHAPSQIPRIQDPYAYPDEGMYSDEGVADSESRTGSDERNYGRGDGYSNGDGYSDRDSRADVSPHSDTGEFTDLEAERLGPGTQRRLTTKPCPVVAGVRLTGKPFDATGAGQPFEVEKYHVPHVLFNNTYVRELLKHGGLDSDVGHSWGTFEDVGAAQWPLFTLRPSLFNLTYIKSLEAPLFFSGQPGRFSEDPNITSWRYAGKDYRYHRDFELEFAVRWVRAGATFATLMPGTCMRDVSNGISSLEKHYDWASVDLDALTVV
eukprot:TRINITY_DN79563_c0_g1_i1.p1 TRINITY_DN79563_c0_g1~~TRINITY_DN79563_c0_g1_i1.p1  ORF type:complete len:1188 (-),score=184.08 TRINITY_DN79563_c0_g1_i1:217-3780(-)